MLAAASHTSPSGDDISHIADRESLMWYFPMLLSQALQLPCRRGEVELLARIKCAEGLPGRASSSTHHENAKTVGGRSEILSRESWARVFSRKEWLVQTFTLQSNPD
jgi:hypothetical protein